MSRTGFLVFCSSIGSALTTIQWCNTPISSERGPLSQCTESLPRASSSSSSDSTRVDMAAPSSSLFAFVTLAFWCDLSCWHGVQHYQQTTKPSSDTQTPQPPANCSRPWLSQHCPHDLGNTATLTLSPSNRRSRHRQRPQSRSPHVTFSNCSGQQRGWQEAMEGGRGEESLGQLRRRTSDCRILVNGC